MTDTHFAQIEKDNLLIGIDFGCEDDGMAIETITSFQYGVINIVSSNIIGRAKDFRSQEKRDQYLKRYKE